jgi:hypothetical protein
LTRVEEDTLDSRRFAAECISGESRRTRCVVAKMIGGKTTRGIALGTLLVALCWTSAPSEADAPKAPATGAAPAANGPLPGQPTLLEHRYRIVGKLRLALLWIGRDDVGGARMRWRSDGVSNELTLLVGSDPRRAPRNLNQWGYLREEVHPNQSEVFSLRSLGGDGDGDGDDDSAAPPAGFGPTRGPLFRASCSSARGQQVSSTHTTVAASGVTYRMFDQLLDRFADSPPWQERHTTSPAGAVAGFLTALQRALRSESLSSLGSTSARRFSW